MEEKKVNEIIWLMAGLLIIIFVAGGMNALLTSRNSSGKSSVPQTEPETGLQNWIEAVNGGNIDRLYDLAPDEIKQQRTLVSSKRTI